MCGRYGEFDRVRPLGLLYLPPSYTRLAFQEVELEHCAPPWEVGNMQSFFTLVPLASAVVQNYIIAGICVCVCPRVSMQRPKGERGSL